MKLNLFRLAPKENKILSKKLIFTNATNCMFKFKILHVPISKFMSLSKKDKFIYSWIFL